MSIRHPQPPPSTTVSSRYQTVIPADVRERFCIREGSKILWIVKDDTIEVVPLPEEPWRKFHGAGRGEDNLAALLEYRKQERAKDEERVPREGRCRDKR